MGETSGNAVYDIYQFIIFFNRLFIYVARFTKQNNMWINFTHTDVFKTFFCQLLEFPASDGEKTTFNIKHRNKPLIIQT